MFHQVRVDCGTEFYLTLGMQEIFKELRSKLDIRCYQQTESKKVIVYAWFEPNGNC